jgi:diketogulonate reductase-like aldo/keto reductase
MTQKAVPAAELPGGGAMPLLGFGTWQLRGRACRDAVRAALDVGYRHVDTATIYRNEAEVGRALRESGVPRDEVFLTTKSPAGDRDPRRTLTASLEALGVDAVDLWLIHWPGNGSDVDRWRQFVAERDAGRARAIGVSNFSLREIDALHRQVGVLPAVNQIRWGPALYDPAVERGHRERGVVLEGYSPFKSTNLRDPVLVEIAERHGATPGQVVLRWHLEHGVVVIPKSAHPERIAENFAAADLALTADEVARIDALAGR